MTNFSDVAERYIGAWNEGNAELRLSMVSQLWTSEGSYTDPMAEAVGPAAISAVMGAVQEQFPGFEFDLIGRADGHHAQMRFQWGLGPKGQEPVIIGFDVVQLHPDGAIEFVLGFLDRVPGAA